MILSQSMKKLNLFFDNYGMVIALSSSFLLNIIFYYLGLAFIQNKFREYLFIGFKILIFVCSLCLAVRLWINKKDCKSVFITNGIVIVLFAISVSITLFRIGINKRMLDIISRFIIFCIPAMIFGISTGFGGDEDFIKSYEKCGTIIVPAVFSYVIMQVFNLSPFSNFGLGIINYMSLAYGIMPFLFVLMFSFLFNRKSSLDFLKTEKINSIRFLIILFFVSAIIITGTRGAIFSVVLFTLSLVTTLLIKKLFIKRVILLLIAFIIIFASIFLLFSFRKNNITGRMSVFVNSLLEGEFASNSQIPLTDAQIRPYLDIPLKDAEMRGIPEDMKKITNRMSLYRIAFLEAKKHPLFGLGATAFSLKYGKYPHNAVLEILAEFGFIIGTAILLFILFCLSNIIYISIKERKLNYMIFFLIGYMVMYSSSSSFWYSDIIFFGIGYSIALRKFHKMAIEKKV